MFNLVKTGVKFYVHKLLRFWGGTYGTTIYSIKRVTRTIASCL